MLPVWSALKIARSPEVAFLVQITSSLNSPGICPYPHPFAIQVALQFMAFAICHEGSVEAEERAGAFESVSGEVEFFHLYALFASHN